jgi:hypothetical protein
MVFAGMTTCCALVFSEKLSSAWCAVIVESNCLDFVIFRL